MHSSYRSQKIRQLKLFLLGTTALLLLISIVTSITVPDNNNVKVGLSLPKVHLPYKSQPRPIEISDLYKEFQTEGHTLPIKDVLNYAIYTSKIWSSLQRRVDQKTGASYYQQHYISAGYGKIYGIGLVINSSLENILRGIIGAEDRPVELKLSQAVLNRLPIEKSTSENSILRVRTGSILPGSLYKGFDHVRNEFLGGMVAYEHNLPPPFHDRRYLVRVFIHHLIPQDQPVIVGEWYQAEEEGDFKFLRGCHTIHLINEKSQWVTIKVNGDVGGVAGMLINLLDLDSIKQGALKDLTIQVKTFAEQLEKQNKKK